jgi:L-aminopeptidase/D-esterase-like protein
MIHPGPRNSLTDIAGLMVGNAEDHKARTGVTVVLADPVAMAAVDVRGGAPGTINTEGLALGGLIREAHGLVLAGGSTFGLEAASGLMAWLAARGRGFGDWGTPIPLVSGAILFDLMNDGDKDWGTSPPYRALAQAAADTAGADFALGNAGAGFGAMAGPLKGGLGTASAFDPATGATVAALVAANPVGGVTLPGSATFYAWHLEQNGELGGQPPPTTATGHEFETKGRIGQATTIGIVATDAAIGREDLQRLAIMSQDGFAYAIRPIHSPFDGDTILAVATRANIAADATARAVMRGVYEAEDLGDLRCYRSTWGSQLQGGR